MSDSQSHQHGHAWALRPCPGDPLPERPQARVGGQRKGLHTVGAQRLGAPRSGARAWGLSTLSALGGEGKQAGPHPVASSLQPPQDDAAIVGAVRLFAVMIAALTMDRAGRKVLLFVSGEPPPPGPRQQLPGTVPLEVGAVWPGSRAWVGSWWPLPRTPGTGPGSHQLPQRSLGSCERTAPWHSVWGGGRPNTGGAASLEVTGPRGL